MSSGRTSSALEAIDRILNRGGDADDVLRAVVAVLHERAGYAWAAIFFVEGGELALGPSAGEPVPDTRTRVPVAYGGDPVGELAVDGAAAGDAAFLERVATLISAYCLVGWDTGGEEWSP
jgi:putative methionine-R-sulfoxide reductase with GAF domain